ncbi:OmpA family protein [Mucilaginibacter achroorhodeus]|uniref:OmpA family protein n=1 Tax=Mucilaginibacter achroorhodeus TaxID=2599294 RepID=A0A563U648_9SPHI|nr:OmpA family protein [Mucilaginibacter achroorhodeus]TWR26789.1 OmpA family protein [Mucilaginibacter achroorhodeus]
MSFNLNKNDGRTRPVRKTDFDLSKQMGSNSAGLNQPAKATKWWLFGLALLLAGGGYWYATNNNGGTNSHQNNKPTVVQQVGKDSVIRDTMRPVSDKMENPVEGDIASKDNASHGVEPAVVAASYRSGAVQPASMTRGVVNGLKKKLAKDPSVKITVLGYASSEGSLQINQRISQERADAFKNMLIRRGVAEGRVTAKGRGVENPIASNGTEEGRRKNRRVEVLTVN